MSYGELLRGKEETLLRVIHPNVLLLALLTEHDLVDECTEQAIAAERTDFDRNRRLLEWLKQSPREAFDGFLRALRTNGQEHVANYIDGTPGNREKVKLWLCCARFVNLRNFEIALRINNVCINLTRSIIEGHCFPVTSIFVHRSAESVQLPRSRL